MNLAERLSEYALGVGYRNLDERTVVEAKKRVIDSLGCAIGAFAESPVKVARRVVESTYRGSSSTVLGTKAKASPDMATFVNCLMTRYFDYNDTYLSKEPAHPSDNIPACLAVAEMEGCSGKEVLAAIVVAYEVQCRLCDSADIRHRGWDHVCYGLVSAALASGKLLGLQKEKLAHAVNISLNSHIAMRQVRAGELSEWKGASFANAARNAVFSSMLAKGGMTGPSPIFEGEMGFFKQVSGPFEMDPARFGGIEGTFKLPGTYVKYFPAEYHSQSAIWAALRARARAGQGSDIDRVEVSTHEAGYTILAKDEEKWSPSTKETADHSLPYIVGMALLEGRIDNGTYSPKKFEDPKVLKFLRRITVREDKSLTAMYPASIANRVAVRLSDGRSIVEQVNDPRGHPSNPMTGDEIEAKFRRLTKRFLKESQVKEILRTVWQMEKQKDLSELLQLCALS